jgi:Hsp70 protein
LRDSTEPEKIGRLLRVLEQRKGHDLLAGVESAKIKLSRADLAMLNLDDCVAGISREITRAELEAAISDSLQRMRSRIDDALRMAGLAPDSVSAVFLTGGANAQSMIPARTKHLSVLCLAKVCGSSAPSARNKKRGSRSRPMSTIMRASMMTSPTLATRTLSLTQLWLALLSASRR